jgi:tyrosine-protein kinase Etk/Wzc
MNSNITMTPNDPLLSQDIDFFGYLSTILRRKKAFALVFLSVFIGVALYTFMMKPIYEASATLHVKDDKAKAGILGELSLNNADPISAELEILKSRTNAEQVVKNMHLDWLVDKQSKGLNLKLVEFSSSAKEPVYEIELTGADTFTVKDKDGELVGEGKTGLLMQGKEFHLLLNNLSGKRGDSFRLRILPFDNVVAALRGVINAAEVGKQTSIIRVAYTSTDPTRARDVVNTLVKAYLEQSISLKAEEARLTVDFVEEQLQGLRKNLDISEKNLQVYKSSSGVINLDFEAQALISQISIVETNKIQLEMQKRALLSDYTKVHPAVKALAEQQEAIKHQLAFYDKQMQKLPVAERELAGLTRIYKVNGDVYSMLLQKQQEARIAKASTITNIDIVDPAITPGSPIKPKKGIYLFIGLLFGCILGAGFVFFQEYLDDTIKDADEAKRVMGIPLLGVIPHIPQHAPNGNFRDPLSLFTNLEPKSMVSESFRSLRTNIHFSAINKDKKIILFTSTFPEEGKSTITANLANIFSQTGARVLIIDCDLRRSSLHKKFGHSKTPGLSELLTGDITFAEAKHNTGISGLDLISAGTTPPNPSELLGSEAMRQFLLTQRGNYDHVLIDAPPVMAVTDAPVLTAIVDMVILVIETMRVPVNVVRHMRDLLSGLHAPVAGFVLNDKTGRGESYGYYGGRYYRYGKGKRNGYGYGYYSDEEPKPKGKIYWWEKLIPEKWRSKLKKAVKGEKLKAKSKM